MNVTGTYYNNIIYLLFYPGNVAQDEIWFESHISYESLVPVFREENVPAWGARVLRRQCRVWFVGSDSLAQLRQRGRKCLQK